MEQCSFLELQLNSLDVLAALVIDVDIDKNEVATNPGLTVEACRLRALGSALPLQGG